MGQVVAGNLWGWVFQVAIPQEAVFGFDLKFLDALIPFAIALGIHMQFFHVNLHLNNYLNIRCAHCWKCGKN